MSGLQKKASASSEERRAKEGCCSGCGKHLCVCEHESCCVCVVNWAGWNASQLPDTDAVTAWVSWQVHSLESVGELSLWPGSSCDCICVPVNVAETVTCDILADANICQIATWSKQSKDLSCGRNCGWECREDSSTCKYCTISDSRCWSNGRSCAGYFWHSNFISTKQLPTEAVKSGSITQSPCDTCGW